LVPAPKTRRRTMWALVLGGGLALAMVFLLVPHLHQVDQVPREQAFAPAIDRGDDGDAVMVEAEPEVVAAPGDEAESLDPARPMEMAAPEVGTVLPAEPVQEPEAEPAVVMSAGEETPPVPEDPVAESREADAVGGVETEEAFFLYTVQPGDTLGGIAVKQLCQFWAWRNIYEQNRALIREPEKLGVGTVLRLDRRDNRCPPGP